MPTVPPKTSQSVPGLQTRQLGTGPRIPPAAGKIQVNFCKNPKCDNFGVPAKDTERILGRYSGREDTYRLKTSGQRAVPTLTCKLCGEYPTIKSNEGISEELSRFMAPLQTEIVSCPNSTCENHTVAVGAPGAYLVHGTTAAGTQRYKCKRCGKTFSGPSYPAGRHRQPDKNKDVFEHLVNKSVLRRICKITKITPPVLYDKIDFIHERCLAFAAAYEAKLPSMDLHRLYLASDRQGYILNWPVAEDRRNVGLWSMGTADLRSGYVFALHVNYDPSLDPQEVERDAIAAGDYGLQPAFRKYSRLWLQRDYAGALKLARTVRVARRANVEKKIEASYKTVVRRKDVEAPEIITNFVQFPTQGMQVREEYCIYGHFFFLRKLLAGTEKVAFYLDQDSGMRAGCLAAFADRIKQGRCDAFYVKINKDLTVRERERLLKDNKELIEAELARHPGMNLYELRLMLMKRNMANPTTYGKWNDLWVTHPFPHMGEPEKATCYLTDIQDYDDDHRARLYGKASLHAIDRFFMQIRRSLYLLERPISTASNNKRRWYGYSPYNPAMVAKVLDIYRVYYNFVEATRRERKMTKEERKRYKSDLKVGILQKKPPKPLKTPAMRLGLMDRIVTLEEILGFC